jgi:hypothetical protein
MSDFLQTIAAVFSLGEDATEAQVLAAAHSALANQVPADHTTITAARLTELEQASKVPPGHQVVAHGVIEDLQQRANRADQLDKDLGELKFEQAFKETLDDGRATPHQKTYYLQLFEKDQKLALDLLREALRQVVTAARGDSGYVPAGDAPDGVDVDRHDLDRKVRSYMRTHNLGSDKYAEALEAARDYYLGTEWATDWEFWVESVRHANRRGDHKVDFDATFTLYDDAYESAITCDLKLRVWRYRDGPESELVTDSYVLSAFDPDSDCWESEY